MEFLSRSVIQKTDWESNSAINDKRLLKILQANSSKVVDENGEPQVVYHGTKDYIAEVIINKYHDGINSYYLYEVEEKEKLQGIYQTGLFTGSPRASRLIIAKKLEKVKGKILKIIDETGENKPGKLRASR
jgi:hypothetical protein